MDSKITRKYKQDKVCPWCGQLVKKLGLHMQKCKLRPENLSDDEIKIIGMESYAGKGFLKELIKDYNNLYSLTDLKEKYNIDLKNIRWCLKHENIKIRNISESAIKITQPKIKRTLKEKYGDEIINVFQIPEVREKVKKSFLEHYGVDNIWKTKEYAEFTSKRWASYRKEKKYELIHKWTKQEGTISKLESKIVSIINELGIPLETQFKFKKYFHRYDIHIKDTNILIEVQGDFWHANPLKYKEEDILNFPGGEKKEVRSLWKRDLQNIHYAEALGYKVIQLWENEIINQEKNNNLSIYILDLINQNLN